jgi:hypothetical protein
MPVASSLIKWWCTGDSNQLLVIDLPDMTEAFYGGLVLLVLAGGRLGPEATSRLALLEQGKVGMVRCVATARAPSARGASDDEAGGGDGDDDGGDDGDDDDDDDDGGNDEVFEPITITEDEDEDDGEAGSTVAPVAVTG